MIRSVLFSVAYWGLSVVYVLTALPLLALPGRCAISAWIRSYTRAMRWAMRWCAGIRQEVRGRDKLPEGAFILAAKHQSWGDGFLVYPEIDNLAFVTGDHLEKLPFVGRILRKLGAVVIDTCGGGERKAASLANGMARVAADGRRVLIYPEGHLAPVDHHFRYKSGVWHMQAAMDVPVVPVATNIGLFWGQEGFRKTTGTAVLEFLDPIPPGLGKAAFMAQLTDVVETATAQLVGEARGSRPVAATLLPDPVKGVLAKPLTEATAALPAKPAK